VTNKDISQHIVNTLLMNIVYQQSTWDFSFRIWDI